MGKSSTTIQKADPWADARPHLNRIMNQANQMFLDGGFTPDVYQGQRVAGFGDTSQLGQDMLLNQAQQPGTTGVAQGTISRMMNPDYTSEQLDAVKQNALSSAIPAATSAFSGSGMLNSTMAMDTVGRAAAEAVAPYEYDAFNNAQSRALSAANLAPTLDRASYLPGTITSSVGGAQDAMSQSMIDADMQRFAESANPELNNIRGFADMMLPISGQGGTTSTSQPGPGALATIGGAGLTGLGTYGALAANPATAPFAMIGGLGAGLLGLL